MAPNKTMQNILNPMGKVQSTIASHRMAIGKSAYMERSGGNKFLNAGIFSDASKKHFSECLNVQKKDKAISQNSQMNRLESYKNTRHWIMHLPGRMRTSWHLVICRD